MGGMGHEREPPAGKPGQRERAHASTTLEGARHDAVARATCGWGSARAAPGRPSVAAAAVAIASSFCAFSTGCRLEALLGVTSVRAGYDRPTAVHG